MEETLSCFLPAKSMRNRGEAATQRTHQTAAVSTYGLLSLFAWAAANRRTTLNRDNATQCLKGFLDVTFSELRAMDLDVESFCETAKGECTANSIDGVCWHLRSVKAVLHVGSGCDKFQGLLLKAFECCSCKAVSRDCLRSD